MKPERVIPGGNALPVYTCIATCGECDKELYRVRHVPLMERHAVVVDMPGKALCSVKDHNTFPEQDMNYRATLVWYREVYNSKGKCIGLVKQEDLTSSHGFDVLPSDK